jgi:hypothetical protein
MGGESDFSNVCNPRVHNAMKREIRDPSTAKKGGALETPVPHNRDRDLESVYSYFSEVVTLLAGRRYFSYQAKYLS